MNDSSDHQSFLTSIRANPTDETALLVYADWLDENGDGRANYLRAQVQYGNSQTPELRQQLSEAYPYRYLNWTLALEQCGAVEANLTEYQSA